MLPYFNCIPYSSRHTVSQSDLVCGSHKVGLQKPKLVVKVHATEGDTKVGVSDMGTEVGCRRESDTLG